MPVTKANGIDICHETFGAADARPLLLLRGLGTQLAHWSGEFCQRLADAGHLLVIFDNRDVGLSTHFHGAGMPDLAAVVQAMRRGEMPPLAYTIDDMADDVVGLMDALDLPSAHVAGISMGGMISQVVACRHPDRVRSMTSIMASTGNPELPGPTEEALRVLMTPSPPGREANVRARLETQKVIGSPGYPTDEAISREVAGHTYDRSFDPAGVARQMAAIQVSGDRRPALAKLTVPTLVIHGADDPLVRVEGGRDTARSIPGAELLVIPGMGHDVAPGLHDRLVQAISAHTAVAEVATGA